MQSVLGLDIGRSAVKVFYREHLKVYPLYATFEEEAVSVGSSAIMKWEKEPKISIRRFRDLVGLDYDKAVERLRVDKLLFEHKEKIVKGEKGDVLIHIADRVYSPDEIMELFLKTVFADMESAIPKGVAVTYPAAQSICSKLFESVYVINEILAAILGVGLFHCRGKPILVFDIGIKETRMAITGLRADRAGRPSPIFFAKNVVDIGGSDIDYLILEYLMERDRELRSRFIENGLSERMRLLHKIEKAKIALSEKKEVTLILKNKKEILNQNIINKILFSVKQRVKEVLMEILKRADISPSQVAYVVAVGSPIPQVKDILYEIFEKDQIVETADRDGVIAKGAYLYPSMSYRKVSVSIKREKVSVAQSTYGLFYDRFVPFIYKGDRFSRDGKIKREGIASFSKPDAQIPLIRQDGDGFLCLGVFNFFLPLYDSYKIKVFLELSPNGLTLTGSHPMIGDVVYPNIPVDQKREKRDEVGLLKDMQRITEEFVGQKESVYATISADGTLKDAEAMIKRLNIYLRIPEIKDASFKLTEGFYALKKAVHYSSNILGRDVETKCAQLLNRIAEAGFLLFRHNLFSEDDYNRTIRSLHQRYRF